MYMYWSLSLSFSLSLSLSLSLVSESGGVESIISLLSDDLSSTRVYAISCIISITANGKLIHVYMYSIV